MKIFLLGILALFGFLPSFAQQDVTLTPEDFGFPYGHVTTEQLSMSSYPLDTTADAVVLNEYGETFQESQVDFHLIHHYHELLKIFNEKGFREASFRIPLLKTHDGTDQVYDVRASTFNLVNGEMQETQMDKSKVFSENINKYYDAARFTLPNIQPGSVIEVEYTLESPNFEYFHGWDFQSDIPKVHSEYWAKIPANYTYNIILRGFLKLDENVGSMIPGCLQTSQGTSDCSLYKYGMNNIPAFHSEDFMLSADNYCSSIHYELAQYVTFEGRTINITQKWSDVDLILKNDDDFGRQLKKGKDLAQPEEAEASAGTPGQLQAARNIYTYIRNHYHWDGTDDFETENGLKKTIETKSGDVGDINLLLVCALRDAGFTADPVLLATRDREMVNHLTPVIGDFNYVIVRVQVGDTDYLLDATDPLLGFGVIPMICMNGQGRWIKDNQPSDWMDIPATTTNRESDLFTISMSDDGSLKGTLTRYLEGYKAYNEREELKHFKSQDDFLDDFSRRIGNWRITGMEVDSLSDPDQPLEEVMTLELPGKNGGAGEIFFNPLKVTGSNSNPFIETDRQYPVDFGIAPQVQTVMQITYPSDYTVESLPESVLIHLPDNSGKFLMGAENQGNRITVTANLSLIKGVYSADEYGALRELFSRAAQAEQTDIALKKN